MRVVTSKACLLCGLVVTAFAWSPESCIGQEQVISLNINTGEVIPSDPELNMCCRVLITVTNPEETCYPSDNGTPNDASDDTCDTDPVDPTGGFYVKCNDIATAQDVTVIYNRCEPEEGKICIPNSRIKTLFPKRGDLSCPMAPDEEGVCQCSFTLTEDDPEPVEVTVCSGNACTNPPPPLDVDLETAETVAVGIE